MGGVSSNSVAVMAIAESQARRLCWLLLLATMLFLAGIFLPMLTITKMVFFENAFSLVSGIVELLTGGRYLLFIMVLTFSVVLPLMKIGILYRLLSGRYRDGTMIARYLHLMHEYGRWSMLDVMVVAVLIVTVKLGAIVSIQIHAGLYVFAAAVLLIMYITHRVVTLTGADNNR